MSILKIYLKPIIDVFACANFSAGARLPNDKQNDSEREARRFLENSAHPPSFKDSAPFRTLLLIAESKNYAYA
jgi:hypothetical protein